jgi:hypothetical protein
MKNKKNIWIFLSLITIAALSRLLPHPPNFTAIGSIALFGGMVSNSKYMKYLLPIGALLLSDIVLSLITPYSFFHSSFIWIYSAFILLVALGSYFKKVSVSSVLTGSVLAATFFFLFTNLGVWTSGTMYPMTFTGLISCYAAAIPFYANTLISTVFFSAILFGGYYFVDSKSLIGQKVSS